MEHELKCEAKTHDIGFRAHAKLEIDVEGYESQEGH